jgi:hypothetical protein
MADADEPAATDSDLVAVELAFWDTGKAAITRPCSKPISNATLKAPSQRKSAAE